MNAPAWACHYTFGMSKGIALALILSVAPVALSLGKCALKRQASTASHELRMTAVVTHEGKALIYEKGKNERSFNIQMPGHHYEVLLSNDGKSMGVYDAYGGLSIYSTAGKIIRIVDGNEFLTEKQKAERTGRWACHPEGVWLRSAAVKGGFLHLELYDGKEVRLRMSDGTTMPPH